METNHQARAAAGKSSNISTSQLARMTAAGITAAGKMAVALTLTRSENSRVKGGTALASPIFGGVDNDLEPEHRAARQAKRRQARKAQRVARKTHR